MSRPSALSLARENGVDMLESALAAVSRRQGRDPALIAEITERYHLLAIAVLLEEADRDAFASLLALAAQAEIFLRALDLSGAPEQLIASRAEPFSDALVAGALDAASAIARLAPQRHQDGWEYEDDFLRFHFMHRALLGDDDAALSRVLARWERVLEGEASCHLDVARTLAARDPEAFDAALAAAARDRTEKIEAWRKTPVYDEQLDATESAVFIHGLAAIRLAELRGISVPGEYELMPSLARVPLGAQLPPKDAWRDFRNVVALAGG